jgi:hypothetical protein
LDAVTAEVDVDVIRFALLLLVGAMADVLRVDVARVCPVAAVAVPDDMVVERRRVSVVLVAAV